MNQTNNFQHWDCTNLILLSNPAKKLGIPNPEEVCSKSWIRLARIRRVGTRLQLPHWELRNTGAEHSTNLCFSYSTRHSACLSVENLSFVKIPCDTITTARFTNQLKFLPILQNGHNPWFELTWRIFFCGWPVSLKNILNRWCMRLKVSINQSELWHHTDISPGEVSETLQTTQLLLSVSERQLEM